MIKYTGAGIQLLSPLYVVRSKLKTDVSKKAIPDMSFIRAETIKETNRCTFTQKQTLLRLIGKYACIKSSVASCMTHKKADDLLSVFIQLF